MNAGCSPISLGTGFRQMFPFSQSYPHATAWASRWLTEQQQLGVGFRQSSIDP